VGYFTTNPTKLVLHFSDFSVIFYAIYKNQQTHFTILVALLQGGPRKDLGFCNVAPGVRAAAVRRQFRPGIAGFRPGNGRGVAYGLLGVDLRLGWRQTASRQGHSTASGGGRRWSGWSGAVGGSAGVAARLGVLVDARRWGRAWFSA
jgi:hypothetical protein